MNAIAQARGRYHTLKLLNTLWNTMTTLLSTMLISALAVLVNIGLISSKAPETLYILGLFLPLNYVMMAIHEGLRIPVLADTAQQERFTRRELGQRLSVVYLTMTCAMGVLVLALWCFEGAAMTFFHVPLERQQEVMAFILPMLGVGLVIGLATLTLSALFGLGFARWAGPLGILGTGLNVLITYLAVTYWHLGLNAMVLGAASGSVFLLLAGSVVLFKLGVRLFVPGTLGQVKQVLTNTLFTGVPVMGSFLLLFGFLSAFNYLVSFFGEAEISGFGIAFRIQSFVILPAIALGTAMAICANKALARQAFAQARSVFFIGLGVAGGLYLVIAIAVFSLREELIGLFTRDPEVIASAMNYFTIVAPSYLSLGAVLALMTALEQTGQGLKVLLLNVIFYSVEIALAALLGLNQQDATRMYLVIAVINWLSSLYLCLELGKRLLRSAPPQNVPGPLVGASGEVNE